MIASFIIPYSQSSFERETGIEPVTSTWEDDCKLET